MKHRAPSKLFLAIILLCCVDSKIFAAEDYGQVQDNGPSIIVESGNSNYFKSMLYNVWGRLRALNTQNATGRSPGDTVATIGIRGARVSAADTTAEDDGADNLANNEELALFNRAQQYAQSGQLEQAVSELEVFIEKYAGSELRPNALFSLGVSEATLGETEASKWTLVDFLDEYPAHPLTADAERILEEIEIIELLEE